MKRLSLFALALAALGGCQDHPLASLRYINPALGQVKVETDQTTFELVKPRKLEIQTAKVWAAPAGEPVPDYDYVYILLPEDDGTYQVGPAGAAVWRLVRKDGEESLYQAVTGSVTVRREYFNDNRIHASFDVQMKSVWPPADNQTPAPLSGRITADEDTRLCAGLRNDYQPPLRRLQNRAASAGGQIVPGDEKNKPAGFSSKKRKPAPPSAVQSAQPAKP